MKNFSELADYIISLEKEIEENKETIKSQLNEIYSLQDGLEYSSKIEYGLRNQNEQLKKSIDDLNTKIENLENTYDPIREDMMDFLKDKWKQVKKVYWDYAYGTTEHTESFACLALLAEIWEKFFDYEH